MKIGIIGAGSVGLLFAAYLSEDHDVTVYCRRTEQVEVIHQKGIGLKIGNSVQYKRVNAKFTKESLQEEQLVIITVKQYDIGAVTEALTDQTSHIPLLFLQNGMGHLDYVNGLSHRSILLGTVEHGAFKHSDSVVEHTGQGVTKLAVFRGDWNLAKIFAETLSKQSFLIQSVSDYKTMLIEKLVVNSVINPLTALLKVKNGELVNNSYYYQLMTMVFDELAKVLDVPDRKGEFQHVVSVCKRTSDNYSSMCKDVMEGRRTEIDGILGYVLKEAEKKSQSVPLLQFLYNAVKGTE